jgi:hypothetical protein
LAWTIEYDQAALDQLKKFDRSVQRRIVDYMDQRIALGDNRGDRRPDRLQRVVRPAVVVGLSCGQQPAQVGQRDIGLRTPDGCIGELGGCARHVEHRRTRRGCLDTGQIVWRT